MKLLRHRCIWSLVVTRQRHEQVTIRACSRMPCIKQGTIYSYKFLLLSNDNFINILGRFVTKVESSSSSMTFQGKPVTFVSQSPQ